MNTTHFLNIDLDIESNTDISLLVDELSVHLSKLSCHECQGIYRASFEPHQHDIENIINEYVSAITSLSANGVNLWEGCSKREFNIGFQSGSHPKAYETAISQEVLKKILSVNGQLSITLYAHGSD